MANAITDVIAALSAAGLTVCDTEVTDAPPGPYVIATERDAGRAERERLTLVAHWTTVTIDVRAVARTQNGLRELIADIRQILTGKHLTPNAGHFYEYEWSPRLKTGALGDERHEMSIGYRAHYPTEGAIRP